MGIFIADANLTIFGFLFMMGVGIIKTCITDDIGLNKILKTYNINGKYFNINLFDTFDNNVLNKNNLAISNTKYIMWRDMKNLNFVITNQDYKVFKNALFNIPIQNIKSYSYIGGATTKTYTAKVTNKTIDTRYIILEFEHLGDIKTLYLPFATIDIVKTIPR